MHKSNLKMKQKRWDEIFEGRQFKNVISKRIERSSEDLNQKFILESRFQLMVESLQKTKFGSAEYEALLNECVNLFFEVHPEKDKCDRETVLKMVRDRIFREKIIGELDNKKIPKNDTAGEWPKSGFIPLRQAIKRKDIGQHPKAQESENVRNVFSGNKEPSKYPSPSSDVD